MVYHRMPKIVPFAIQSFYIVHEVLIASILGGLPFPPPVNLKGHKPWILIGTADADVKTPAFWSSDANSWLIGKVPDAGKDWGQKEKRASEDEMAGWHHRCNEHELGQMSEDGEGERGLACCSPWGHRESDTTGQLNNNCYTVGSCYLSI